MTKQKIKATKQKLRPRPRITSTDGRIFANLHKARRPLPVQRLAKRLDISWKTANEHVKKLEKLRILDTRRTIKKTNVSINPNFLKSIRKKKSR